MAAAGLGDDLLLANETIAPARLAALAVAQHAARITVAVDSPETIDAAAAAGLAEVVVDVNIGLPRCGCQPDEAGHLADLARSSGLVVRGTMGYEGHLMAVFDRAEQRARTQVAIDVLLRAHDQVDGELVTAGGTGTYDIHPPHVEVQALGMDHGNPTIDQADVWFCSDEHVTFVPHTGVIAVGERVQVVPAHIDPTVAMHEVAWLVRGHEVIDRWPIDLRGW